MLALNRSITGLTLLAVLAGCARDAAELSQADKEAVKAQIEKYTQAGLAADWDAWGNTLAPDVIALPPNTPRVNGRAAAVAWIKSLPKLTAFKATTDEVSGQGDIAYAHGTYELAMALPDERHRPPAHLPMVPPPRIRTRCACIGAHDSTRSRILAAMIVITV